MEGLGLPRDIFWNCVLPYLNVQDLGRLGQVDRYHRNLVNCEAAWQHIEDRWRRDDPAWTDAMFRFYDTMSQTWYGWCTLPPFDAYFRTLLQSVATFTISTGFTLMKTTVMDDMTMHYKGGKVLYSGIPFHVYIATTMRYPNKDVLIMCKILWDILQCSTCLNISFDETSMSFVIQDADVPRKRLHAVGSTLCNYSNDEVDIQPYKKKLLWF